MAVQSYDRFKDSDSLNGSREEEFQLNIQEYGSHNLERK